MAKITNRMKRAFTFAATPHPDDREDERKKFQAVTANPGETVTVDDLHLKELRTHSAAIFDHLFDGRHLEYAKGSGAALRDDELENPALPEAPEELAINPNPAENVTLERKGLETVSVDLPPAPEEAPRSKSRKA